MLCTLTGPGGGKIIVEGYRIVCMDMPSPAVWKNGKQDSSLLPMKCVKAIGCWPSDSSLFIASYAVIIACVITTGFGKPVLPDV